MTVEGFDCCILVQLSPNCHQNPQALRLPPFSSQDLNAYSAWLGDSRMPEQLLDRHNIHASINEARRERVAQCMPGDIGNACLPARKSKACFQVNKRLAGFVVGESSKISM